MFPTPPILGMEIFFNTVSRIEQNLFSLSVVNKWRNERRRCNFLHCTKMFVCACVCVCLVCLRKRTFINNKLTAQSQQ